MLSTGLRSEFSLITEKLLHDAPRGWAGPSGFTQTPEMPRLSLPGLIPGNEHSLSFLIKPSKGVPTPALIFTRGEEAAPLVLCPAVCSYF